MYSDKFKDFLKATDLRYFPCKYVLSKNILNWFHFQKTETFADNQNWYLLGWIQATMQQNTNPAQELFSCPFTQWG